AVKTREGEALPDFSASILSADKKRTIRPGALEAHAEGKVSLLLPDEPFVVDVRARGHGHAALGPWSPGDAPAKASCKLHTLPGVRGQVFADGEPLANARVELYEMADEHTRIEQNGFLTRLHPEPEDTTSSDEQGYFQLDPGRPGESDRNRFY